MRQEPRDAAQVLQELRQEAERLREEVLSVEGPQLMAVAEALELRKLLKPLGIAII